MMFEEEEVVLSLKASIDRPGTRYAELGAGEAKLERRMKVLSATGSLSPSDATVWRAHALAQDLGAELLLLHVVDASKPVRDARRRSALARSILDAHVRNLGGSSTQTSIRSGRPHDTIAEVAIEWDADLIVLGPYRRRFADELRGTTAERIARKTGRAVLVVNRESVTPYRHVLLTSDLTHMSVGIARVARQLGLLERARASVVHALEQPRNAMFHMAGVNETDIGAYQQSLRRLASDEIDTHLFSAGLDPAHVRIFSPQISPARAIEEVAKRTESDLVVVGSSRLPVFKRLFLGSVSNELLRRTKHDVLLVSPAAARRARRRASTTDTHRLEAKTRERTPSLH